MHYDHAIQMARRGRRIFLAVVAVAALSAPTGAYLTGLLDWLVVAGGLATGAIALAVGLPVINHEIRRLQRERTADASTADTSEA